MTSIWLSFGYDITAFHMILQFVCFGIISFCVTSGDPAGQGRIRTHCPSARNKLDKKHRGQKVILGINKKTDKVIYGLKVSYDKVDAVSSINKRQRRTCRRHGPLPCLVDIATRVNFVSIFTFHSNTYSVFKE
jgi:hypothetical protein